MTASPPRIEDRLCLYAIGDIHGHPDLLQKLVGMIAEDAAGYRGTRRLVFLGDYIDRGPDSRGVIDFLMKGLPPGFESVFLRGNHEDVLLRVLGGEDSLIASWTHFGGLASMKSYGIDPLRPGLFDMPEKLRAELAARIPPQHFRFLKNTVLHHSCGDYFFAHAGVRPGVELARQAEDDLLWIRADFLTSTQDFGKIVVHGHSISVNPDIRPNRIGIDTGAYATGTLTALKLCGADRQWLAT